MPVTLTIDHDRSEATAVATGPITMADIRSHLESERLQRGLPYREWIDATQATADLSSAEARDVVDILRRLGRESALGPTALLVSNDVTYGMARMVEILLDDVADVRPFRVGEEADAKKWLAATLARDKAGGGPS
jgi:hypothetical protein